MDVPGKHIHGMTVPVSQEIGKYKQEKRTGEIQQQPAYYPV
jgi:hypothetical protein